MAELIQDPPYLRIVGHAPCGTRLALGSVKTDWTPNIMMLCHTSFNSQYSKGTTNSHNMLRCKAFKGEINFGDPDPGSIWTFWFGYGSRFSKKTIFI
jgi:hypothetical protein